MSALRHIPPTASPLTISDLRQGFTASIVDGAASARFEEAVARFIGGRAAFTAASGRAALYLLMKALKEGADHPRRRDVLLPAYTCPALVGVVQAAGLRPRFVDIVAETLQFDPGDLEGSVSEQTLALICVHPFGLPHPVEPVIALARGVGAYVIEDAAQAMGARLDGRPVGSWGDFGLFSLGPGKPLSTGGGGIVCAREESNAALLERAWATLSPSSTSRSIAALCRLALFALAFHPAGWWLATRIGLHRLGDDKAHWGFTLRPLTASQAAIGRLLFDRLEAANALRRRNAARLRARLEGLEFLHTPPVIAGAEPVFLRLPLIVAGQERRERLFRRLWNAGIGVGRMYRQALPEIFPELAERAYPGAQYVARHLLTLPTHHYLTLDDVDRIGNILAASEG